MLIYFPFITNETLTFQHWSKVHTSTAFSSLVYNVMFFVFKSTFPLAVVLMFHFTLIGFVYVGQEDRIVHTARLIGVCPMISVSVL